MYVFIFCKALENHSINIECSFNFIQFFLRLPHFRLYSLLFHLFLSLDANIKRTVVYYEYELFTLNLVI